MTDNNHPITPPPELVNQWVSLACEYEGNETWIDLATQAARWGADQELEACCEWFSEDPPAVAQGLRAARRPNWPSLKEQAFQCLKNIDDACESEGFSRGDDTDIIRRALEALPD